MSGLSSAVEASEGDVFVDSGAGWYVRSQYFCNTAGEYLAQGSSYAVKNTDVPCICFIAQSPSQTMIYCVQPYATTVVNGPSAPYYIYGNSRTVYGSTTIDNVRYGYSSTWLDSSYTSNYPVFQVSSSTFTVFFPDVLVASGLTTDSSVLPPPTPSTLFVAGTYNNRPIQVQYGPLITEPVFTQSETLGASYNLYDAAYTPILSSADFVPISGNYKYQVNPVGYNAEYVCFETISYSASEYSSIDVSGEFTFYMQSDYYPLVGGQESRYIFPDAAYLYVNGERVYSNVQSLGNGQFRFSGTLNLSELGNIVSIGVWANFTDSITQIGATSFNVGFYGDNNLVLTPTAVSTVTPDPNASIGDVLVDTQKIEDGINTEIQKQNTIIQQLMSLPQTIGDAISSAFIPDAQLLDDYRDLYGNLLEDRLGFVWQAGTVVLDFVGDMQELLAGIDEDYDLIFPGVQFTMQGQTYELVPRYQVDMENDLMDVLRPTLGTIVGFVCTIAFINTCRDMVISLASGASYMEYIHRREGDN